MFNWIKNLFDLKLGETVDDMQREAEQIDAAHDRHERIKQEMQSKRCPFINTKCQDTCVHFYPGYIAVEDDSDKNFIVMHEDPRCKLWGFSE